ncbi:MAG: MBL fold metallo-hydrolase [Acidobacteria bacterium]|nr:MAG: MBL fold metallo-hydrolase [Acidobacteriota bacterium]
MRTARLGEVASKSEPVDRFRRFIMLLLLLLALLLVPSSTRYAQSKPLDIYWIDVEGGAATLIVSPSGESFLIDTGWMVGDRDAQRIYAATQLAGVKKIDYLLISHFHADHVGGLAAFSKMMPIGKFYDHGDTIEKENQQWLDSYTTASAGRRTIVKPGDEIPVKGLRVLVVASDQKVLAKAVNGGRPNPLCATAEQKAPIGLENQRVAGVLVSYGKFKYLNLIDLDWEKEMELACPVNKLGMVTVYQTSRHGAFDGAGAPAFLDAIRPQVVVVNNGPRKGMGQVDNSVKSITPADPAPYEKVAYLRLSKIPGIEGIWQEHLSLLDPEPKHNTSPDMIANLEETADCKGNWIKASVQTDGKFTVTNSRNGFSKSYVSR